MRPGRALWQAAAVAAVVEVVWCSMALASNPLQETATGPHAATLPKEETTRTETRGWWEGGSRRDAEDNTVTRHDDGTREEQDGNVPDVLNFVDHLDTLQYLQENMIADGPVGGEDGRKANHREGRRLPGEEEEQKAKTKEEEEKGRLFFTGANDQQVTISLNGLGGAVLSVVFLVLLIKLLIYVITGRSFNYWGRLATSAYGDDYLGHSTYSSYRAFEDLAKKYD